MNLLHFHEYQHNKQNNYTKMVNFHIVWLVNIIFNNVSLNNPYPRSYVQFVLKTYLLGKKILIPLMIIFRKIIINIKLLLNFSEHNKKTNYYYIQGEL